MSALEQPPASPGEQDLDADHWSRFRRRELLVAASLMAAAGAVAAVERQGTWIERALRRGGGQPSLTLRMLRPDDMMAFDLDLYNLRITGNPPRLERISPGDAFVVAIFGPQAVLEEAFFEAEKKAESESAKPPPVRSYVSGHSRLAFVLPSAVSSIPFNDESLLRWGTAVGGLLPSLAANADPLPGSGSPRPSEPARTVTGIEVPAAMILSPGRSSAWVHSTEPVVHEGRSELWHTRLASKVTHRQSPTFDIVEGDPDRSTVRAIYSPSWVQTNDGAAPPQDSGIPFGKFNGVTKTSVNTRQRSEIVSLSSDFGLRPGFEPSPIKAKHLMLSTQGAWTDLRGDFPKPSANTKFNVAHFSHRATMGREHFVKVVDRGYLWPFGHEAALIAITERKLEPIAAGAQSGRAAAYLRKRVFVVVTQPSKSYESLDFPFAQVEILTDRTPNLDGFSGKAGIKSGAGSIFGEAAFWPVVGGEDFRFDIVGTDVEGVKATFSLPLIFMLNSTAGDTEKLARINMAHLGGDPERRTAELGGQSVAFAEPSDGKSRDTAFETSAIEFRAFWGRPEKPFTPLMRTASIRVPALAQVAAAGAAARRRARASGTAERGGAAADAASVLVKPAEEYVKNGFDEAKNQAQAYLKLAEKEALDYAKDAAGDACGAIGVPNMDVVGLSRSVGTIGGDLLKGKLPDLSNFSPADFLAGAKFLGIDFAEVLADSIPFPLPNASDLTKVPQQLVETVYEGVEEVKGVAKDLENRIPKEIRTELLWEPALTGPDVPKHPVFLPKNGTTPAKMRLHSLTVVPIQKNLEDPLGDPQVEVTGELTNFGLQLFGNDGFLRIYFNRFVFETRNGQKPTIDVEVRDVEFSGALDFVNELRRLMSYSGNGLSIDVTPQGVEAAYALEVPTITAGIFTLDNIALNAGLSVPFDGKPVRASFSFCSEERPFLLTYTIFGGGGYALAEVNANGVERLAVSLEFGAAAAIDLGVASGSVQVMAGMVIQVAGSEASLTGYVRLNGELDVLGVISVSLEFNLSLTYDTKTDEAWGRAVLSVEVDVTLFSKTVEIECEKRFAGGAQNNPETLRARGRRRGLPPASPDVPITFEQMIEPPDWQQYTSAFAQEAF